MDLRAFLCFRVVGVCTLSMDEEGEGVAAHETKLSARQDRNNIGPIHGGLVGPQTRTRNSGLDKFSLLLLLLPAVLQSFPLKRLCPWKGLSVQ